MKISHWYVTIKFINFDTILYQIGQIYIIVDYDKTNSYHFTLLVGTFQVNIKKAYYQFKIVSLLMCNHIYILLFAR